MDERLVGVLIHDGVTSIDVAGPIDVFHHANMFGAFYRTLLISADGHDALSSSNFRLHADAAVDDGRIDLDILIIPGAYGMLDKPLPAAVVRAVDVLSRTAHRIASLCTGSFLLAEAGQLNGRRATTHWTRIEKFRRSYPSVRVRDGVLFVRDGSLTTAAGIGSGIDVALAYVEDDYGPAVTQKVVWQMILHMQRPGGLPQRSSASHASVAADRPLRAVIDAVNADPQHKYGLAEMASIANVSVRQLARHFEAELGTTPARYVEDVRIEFARALLEQGRTVAAAADLSGFGTGERLRRVFLTRLGMSPSVYAARSHSS